MLWYLADVSYFCWGNGSWQHDNVNNLICIIYIYFIALILFNFFFTDVWLCNICLYMSAIWGGVVWVCFSSCNVKTNKKTLIKNENLAFIVQFLMTCFDTNFPFINSCLRCVGEEKPFTINVNLSLNRFFIWT